MAVLKAGKLFKEDSAVWRVDSWMYGVENCMEGVELHAGIMSVVPMYVL